MKKLIALALACIMVLSLAACGGSKKEEQPADTSTPSAPTTEAPAEPTKLTLILRGGTYADVIKECLPAFEAEHNVTCEVLDLAEDDLHSKIALDAMNKEGAYDLCMVDGSWMAEFTANGVLANLSEMGYSFDDDIIPATTAISYYDGDIYLASALVMFSWANTVVKGSRSVGLGLMIFLLVEVSAMSWTWK